jgi:hypothetical protein
MLSLTSPAGRVVPLLAFSGALIVGVYARFRGLGAAPLSVDEYYLVRSIDNVLRSGLPAYRCGGFYTRGLILQYLSAGLRIAGTSPELAPRLVAALCSLFVLPAAYLLGRRISDANVGTLAAILLAVSVWEIEMGRFGRMYAPFQLVCVWYLLSFVRYTVDRDTKALWPMLLLSLVAPLVWEGGALLGLANLLPPFLQQRPGNRLTRTDWLYLSGTAVIFAASYGFVTADFRGYVAASWPPGFNPALQFVSTDPLNAFNLPLRRLPEHPGWIAAGAAPLAATLWALRWLWNWRSRPLAATGLLAMLTAALLHQFGAVLEIALLLLLLNGIRWEELFSREAAPLLGAILVSTVFWLAFGAASTDWHSPAAGTLPRALAAFGYQYLRFPDLLGVVVRPWTRAVPHLALALCLLIGAAFVRQARSTEPLNTERALLVVFLVLLLAASASHPPRQETRYVFFLYPLGLLIALTTLARAARRLVKPRNASLAAAVLSLSGFALAEDFQPHHLLKIDRPSELFRSGMNLDMQAHLEIRNDYREMAHWLSHRVAPDADVVVNGVHGLDYYYPAINNFFVDQRDPDFKSWSCRGGSVERWGNYPLLYSVKSLKARIAASRHTYLIFYPNNNPGLLASLAEFSPQVSWLQGYVAIVTLRGKRP